MGAKETLRKKILEQPITPELAPEDPAITFAEGEVVVGLVPIGSTGKALLATGSTGKALLATNLHVYEVLTKSSVPIDEPCDHLPCIVGPIKLEKRA